RDEELGARARDETPIVLERAGHGVRVDEPPAVPLEELEIGGLVRMNRQGELELGRGSLRQVGEPAEFVHAETVGAAAVLDRPVRPAPGCDSREWTAVDRVRRPTLEDDRRPRV